MEAEPTKAAPPRRKRRWFQFSLRALLDFAVVAAVLCVAAIVCEFFAIFHVFDRNPGRFDGELFEAVVAEVRTMNLTPGRVYEFKLEDLSDAKSLRRLKSGSEDARESREGYVWAEVTPAGNLKVVIETHDLGHLGSYGFAYLDAALSPQPDSGGWYWLDVPGPLNQVLPDMKIDEHWWKVQLND